MANEIDISEIVGSVKREDREIEVCAAAQGAYDDAQQQLEVTLDAFLRPVDLCRKEERLPAAWLPKRQTLRERVPWEESSLMMKEIFQRWVGKVRQSIPSSANP